MAQRRQHTADEGAVVADPVGDASESRAHTERRRAVLVLIVLAVLVASTLTAWLVVTLNRDFKQRAGSAAPATETRRASTPRVTSAPSPSPRTRACVVAPHQCGFPDETNTGVPDGTVLRAVPAEASSGKGWHYDSHGWIKIDGDGALLDGIQNAGGISVEASNVTIQNCRLDLDTSHQTASSHSGAGILVRNGSQNVTIKNCEIYGRGTGADRLEVGIKIQEKVTGTRVIGNNIYHVCTGVQGDAGIVEDNYIHDFGFTDWGPPDGPDHLNGFTSNAYTGPIIIRHNTILNDKDQTDAVGLFEDFGAQHDRVIDNNLLAGGGYTIYGGANDGGPPTHNIVITNNRISRMYSPRGGHYGPLAAFDPTGPGNVWSGNVWDETGQVIEP